RSAEVGAIEEAFTNLRTACHGAGRRGPVPPLPFPGAPDSGPAEELFPEVHSALPRDNRCGSGIQGRDTQYAEIPEDERRDGCGEARRQDQTPATASARAGHDVSHAAWPRSEVSRMLDVGSWMLVVTLLAQDRPGLFFREDWKETP